MYDPQAAEEMSQEDIDKAIEYLFPAGLYERAANPLMKPPEEVGQIQISLRNALKLVRFSALSKKLALSVTFIRLNLFALIDNRCTQLTQLYD